MSYTKQTWAIGDTVTATKLNHMEDGIAGAGGYDAEITITGVDYSNLTGTIISGDYATLSSMIANNTLPVVKVNILSPSTGVNFGGTVYQGEGMIEFGFQFDGNLILCDWASDESLDVFID